VNVASCTPALKFASVVAVTVGSIALKVADRTPGLAVTSVEAVTVGAWVENEAVKTPGLTVGLAVAVTVGAIVENVPLKTAGNTSTSPLASGSIASVQHTHCSLALVNVAGSKTLAVSSRSHPVDDAPPVPAAA
jgi:hypothetical protein